jgi:N-acetyl-anhydromuramyl-L-alanine amidase AmpD
VRVIGTTCLLLWVAGCASVAPGDPVNLIGDEISIAGRLFHTGTRVVRWTEPGGFDAYRLHRHAEPEIVAPADEPERTARFDTFRGGLDPATAARVRERGFDLPDLCRVVRQVVLHYDAAGSASKCFTILHDRRGLSCHFLLDLDGTVYQTLDVKERAWHAGPANDRSVGIEIANLGAYPDREALGPSGPGEPEPERGRIRGRELWQRPFTDAQYEALSRLVFALCRVLAIPAVAPRDAAGRVIENDLPPVEEMIRFPGLVAHFHVSAAKVDPGPAFDWDRLFLEIGRWGDPSGR